jgi:hypothetical protein
MGCNRRFEPTAEQPSDLPVLQSDFPLWCLNMPNKSSCQNIPQNSHTPCACTPVCILDYWAQFLHIFIQQPLQQFCGNDLIRRPIYFYIFLYCMFPGLLINSIFCNVNTVSRCQQHTVEQASLRSRFQP